MLLYNLLKIKNYQKEIINHKGVWDIECPSCHSKRSFHRHGTYKRYFITIEDQSLVYDILDILRLKCSSCNATHAILPGDIIPYDIYSYTFKILIISTVINDETPVLAVTDKFSLSFQAIYSFLKNFISYLDRIIVLYRELFLWKKTNNPSSKDILNIMIKETSFILKAFFEKNKTLLFLTRNHFKITYIS